MVENKKLPKNLKRKAVKGDANGGSKKSITLGGLENSGMCVCMASAVCKLRKRGKSPVCLFPLMALNLSLSRK